MKIKYLFFISFLSFGVFSCTRSEQRKYPVPLPTGSQCAVRFIGDHVKLKNPVYYTNMHEDLKLDLSVDYIKDIDTVWSIGEKKENRIPTESEIKDIDPAYYLSEPIKEYVLNQDNIKVYINDCLYENSFELYYTNNDNCQLVIKAPYVVNDITIKCVAIPRNYLYLKCALLTALSMYTHVGNPDKYKSEEVEPVHIKFKTKYQNTFGLIPLLGNYAYGVIEDDDIDLTISLNENQSELNSLPSNVVIKKNSRWIFPGEFYSREITYKGGTTKVIKYHFYIPHYFVDDHVSIRDYELN